MFAFFSSAASLFWEILQRRIYFVLGLCVVVAVISILILQAFPSYHRAFAKISLSLDLPFPQDFEKITDASATAAIVAEIVLRGLHSPVIQSNFAAANPELMTKSDSEESLLLDRRLAIVRSEPIPDASTMDYTVYYDDPIGSNAVRLLKAYLEFSNRAIVEEQASLVKKYLETNSKSIEMKIAAEKYAAYVNREVQIAHLEEQKRIAEKLGLKDPPRNDAFLALAAPPFLLGVRALELEIQAVRSRDPGLASSETLSELLKKKHLLQSAVVNTEAVSAFVLRMEPALLSKSSRPNDGVIISFAIVVTFIFASLYFGFTGIVAKFSS